MIRIVKTRYAGATDHRGSRIIATDMASSRSVVVPYPHEAADPHALAADRIYTKQYPGQPTNWLGSQWAHDMSIRLHVYSTSEGKSS